jgi:hypothetical protein
MYRHRGIGAWIELRQGARGKRWRLPGFMAAVAIGKGASARVSLSGLITTKNKSPSALLHDSYTGSRGIHR